MSPKVSVVIPNYNGKEYLEKCVESLFLQDVSAFEIIIVDDASDDGSFDSLKKKYPPRDSFPIIKYIARSENGGFCSCVNDGILNADSQYVILLNNDTEVEPSFVRSLHSAISRNNRIFSVAAKMISLHDKKKIDDSGDLFCSLGWAFSPGKDKSIDKYNKKARIFAGCGGATIYRRNVLLRLGMFDVNHFAYLEDIDIGFRAKLHGYINMYEPTAICYHAGSATSGSRYNGFKIKLAAQNSMYVIYKNMPTWMLLVNLPQIAAGIVIKSIFFARKKYLREYLEGIRNGIKLSLSKKGRKNRMNFDKIPLKRQILIEAELLINTLRRLFG